MNSEQNIRFRALKLAAKVVNDADPGTIVAVAKQFAAYVEDGSDKDERISVKLEVNTEAAQDFVDNAIVDVERHIERAQDRSRFGVGVTRFPDSK